jgi:hypothetical protein
MKHTKHGLINEEEQGQEQEGDDHEIWHSTKKTLDNSHLR